MTHRSIFETIINKIRELLQSDEFLDAHRVEKHFIRKRLLSMYQVVLFLIYTTKQKMDTNIDNIRLDLPNIKFPNISKQALSKARQGIKPSLFESFFDLTVDIFYSNRNRTNLWMEKFHLFAIDGSRAVLPPSKSNFETFGERFSKQNPKRRWSEALMSTAYDVCNDMIVHGMIWHGLASEREMALSHLKIMESLNLVRDNTVFIFDRGYYSEKMFRFFYEKGYFCLMRLKESYNISKQCRNSCITTKLKGDPKEETEDIPIRVIRIDLGNGTTEYLATNIPENEIPLEMYKELYFRRWPIEKKYDELKNKLQIEEFSGVTSTSIQQEFYINLLLTNLAAIVKAEADIIIEETSKPTNKYRYQANRSYIIGRLKKLFPLFLGGTIKLQKILDLFNDARKVKSQIQPDRSNPRKKGGKSRERKHFKNRKCCV